tara:strand:+ start:573343 stop:574122 length:780 start_codon:yes stop_codon:yes gene_type:complete
MPKKLLVLSFFIIALNLFSQENRKQIFGVILTDSIAVENAYIINKTSTKATVSNHLGAFQIPVKENDILLISSVQFESQRILINKTHLETLELTIYLQPYIRQLEEVVLKKTSNMAMELGLPNADKKPLTRLEGRLNYYSKASLPLVILGTLLGQQGGIENLYYIISGDRKDDRKLKALIENDRLNELKQQTIQDIRIHFKDDFFTGTLQIPKEHIDLFIASCEPKNIIHLFNKNKTLEVTDILIKESTVYLKALKNEK